MKRWQRLIAALEANGGAMPQSDVMMALFGTARNYTALNDATMRDHRLYEELRPHRNRKLRRRTELWLVLEGPCNCRACQLGLTRRD